MSVHVVGVHVVGVHVGVASAVASAVAATATAAEADVCLSASHKLYRIGFISSFVDGAGRCRLGLTSS